MAKSTEKEFWQDIDVYSVNTEPRSAAGFPRDEAWEKKTVSLNGVWKFHYCESVNDIIEGYYAPDFDLFVELSYKIIAKAWHKFPCFGNINLV